MDTLLDTAPDIVRRINEAADQLFDENGQTTFPNVDLVRRRARANMNHVSLVMRDWRRRHSTPVETVEDALPATLRDAGTKVLNAFWHEASTLANTRLHEAQSIWERERCELDEMRDQLAAAFDAQTTELAASQAIVEELTQQLHTAVANQDVHQQRAHDAESKAKSNGEVLAMAQAQLQEMTRLLHAANTTQERLAEQLSGLHSTSSAAAEQHLVQQTLLAEQLSQALQEVARMRAQLTSKSRNARTPASALRPVNVDGAARSTKSSSTATAKRKRS